jgi:hypothetical protein
VNSAGQFLYARRSDLPQQGIGFFLPQLCAVAAGEREIAMTPPQLNSWGSPDKDMISADYLTGIARIKFLPVCRFAGRQNNVKSRDD